MKPTKLPAIKYNAIGTTRDVTGQKLNSFRRHDVDEFEEIDEIHSVAGAKKVLAQIRKLGDGGAVLAVANFGFNCPGANVINILRS
jgi:hypothetical protein